METEKRPRGRPRTGITPKRNIRLGDIWDRCAALAEQRGESMTTFVGRALEREEKRLLRKRRHVPTQVVTDLATGETRILPKRPT